MRARHPTRWLLAGLPAMVVAACTEATPEGVISSDPAAAEPSAEVVEPDGSRATDAGGRDGTDTAEAVCAGDSD